MIIKLTTENDIKAKNITIKQVGATTTILLKHIIAKYFITSLESTLFALGIYEDTGSLFTFSSTTKEDIDVLSYLFLLV